MWGLPVLPRLCFFQVLQFPPPHSPKTCQYPVDDEDLDVVAPDPEDGSGAENSFLLTSCSGVAVGQAKDSFTGPQHLIIFNNYEPDAAMTHPELPSKGSPY